jgi:hypothetical protein
MKNLSKQKIIIGLLSDYSFESRGALCGWLRLDEVHRADQRRLLPISASE